MPKHWSTVEYLHKTVKNTNIHIRGTHSYYSHTWTGSFEESVVRYHYGDAFSLQAWKPQWPIDQLYIGDYVCIGAEAVILMGGNHTHRTEWFSLYPFPEYVQDAYIGKGDTVIENGAWIGMRTMIMPGVRIGEGAVLAAGTIVTKDVAPYMIVAGHPAQAIRPRFPQLTVDALLKLGIYTWEQAKFDYLKRFLCSGDLAALQAASLAFDQHRAARSKPESTSLP